ncbi:Enoyl-CoA hydratase [Candidatus Terasakiella magnetica]|nr:Enoyl-CoA hydratase [Candidatus Terasakiella magnetica]
MSTGSFAHLTVELQGSVAVVGLNRPDKRNAIHDPLIDEIHQFFSAPPEGVRVVVLHGHGPHFSSGLDLSEHRDRDAFEVMLHSQKWHRTFHAVQLGGLPVVTAMQGAVVGGGLELATSTHVRVAEPSTFYALPEGQRGIFVGGGGSVRIARVIGAGRMAEMMLTGHAYNAQEGQAMGLSHHLVGEGEALPKALDLARRIADNAPLSNYAVVNALPRIADMAQSEGLFTESLMAAMAQTSTEARERMRAFLEKRGPKAGA